jgi:hypothetical protein
MPAVVAVLFCAQGCRTERDAELASSSVAVTASGTGGVGARARAETSVVESRPGDAERARAGVAEAMLGAAPEQVAPRMLDTLYRLTGSGDGPLSRIVGGVLTDDEIIVAEASTNRLHVYDRSTGAFLRSEARSGAGPGEFRRLTWLQRTNERLYAFDLELGRLSILSLDGQFLRTLQVVGPVGARRPSPIGVFSDGSILAQRVAPSDAFSDLGAVQRPPEPMVVAPRYMLSRHTADGEFLVDLLVYRGSESFVAPSGRAGASQTGALFGRYAAVAISESTFAVLATDGDSIVQYASDGARMRQLRPPPAAAVRVQASDVKRQRVRSIPLGPSPIDLGAQFDLQTPPVDFPPYGRNGVNIPPLIAAGDGTFWLLRYGGVRSLESVYLRFSPAGALVDSLRFPRLVRLLDAAFDQLLVGVYDADGADQVLLLRFAPPR